MTQRYLEITYRAGRSIAAYLYLPRQADDRVAETHRYENGLLVDVAEDGRTIGVEITSPATVTLDELNAVLAAISVEPVSASDFAPLRAA